jgi:cyclopropane fatty-acyl-phospholipid synthase-like methyltransferase
MPWKSIFYRSAEKYEELLYTLHGEAYDFRFKKICSVIEPGDNVIDLGCGTCHLAKFIPESVNYIGVDLNREFLKQSEKQNIKTLNLDIFDISKYPKGYETAVLVDMLHHLVPRTKDYLRELGKFGFKKIIICESFNSGAKAKHRLLAAWIDRDGVTNFWQRLKHHLFSEYSIEDLKNILKQTINYQSITYHEFESTGEIRKYYPNIRIMNLLAIIQI